MSYLSPNAGQAVSLLQTVHHGEVFLKVLEVPQGVSMVGYPHRALAVAVGLQGRQRVDHHIVPQVELSALVQTRVRYVFAGQPRRRLQVAEGAAEAIGDRIIHTLQTAQHSTAQQWRH